MPQINRRKFALIRANSRPKNYLLWLIILLAACSTESETAVLRLATTTSTDNSGLLQAILPDFEAKYNASVEVVAVGTGQALALGEAGDADIILVHARVREGKFVAEGHGTGRFNVMYNDFVIVGPTADPAGINGMTTASEALSAIATTQAPFASRGDDSGTHIKELSLWKAAGITPNSATDWYSALGQGMGATLNFANESQSYTLTDRATFLSQQKNLPNLTILLGGQMIANNTDPNLFNPYSVVPINPDKGNINTALANDFVDWLTSTETQAVIEKFGIDIVGSPLFIPDSEVWRSR